MSLDQALTAHIHSAITVIEEQGFFAPTMWAESETDRIMAVCSSTEAAQSDDDRTWILAWMADVVGATVAGRTDEVWTRSMSADEAAELEPGTLASWVERDPLVRTGVVVHAIDLSSGIIETALAVPEVGDDGVREWSMSRPEFLGGASTGSLLESYRLVHMIEDDGSTASARYNRLRRAMIGMGWTLARFPI